MAGPTFTLFPARANPSRSKQALFFARNFLKHPRMVGSVTPSSRFLIERMLSEIFQSLTGHFGSHQGMTITITTDPRAQSNDRVA